MIGDRDQAVVLALAASLVRTVDEALSAAIVETASEGGIALGHERVELITDKGVAGSVDGHTVVLGNSLFLADLGLSVGVFGEWAERTTPEGHVLMLMAVDGQLAGFLRLATNDQREKI